MRRIAVVFTQSPHGSAGGREGLDAVLAASALTQNIGLFFIADGVLQLLPQQQPEQILSRNYVATFGVLALYDITACYMCAESLQERGLSVETPWVIDVECLSRESIQKKLSTYDAILTF